MKNGEFYHCWAMTAAECGVEYADQYLNTAYALIQAYAKQGQVLSVKSAIEMARSGNIPYDMLYATERSVSTANRSQTRCTSE